MLLRQDMTNQISYKKLQNLLRDLVNFWDYIKIEITNLVDQQRSLFMY